MFKLYISIIVPAVLKQRVKPNPRRVSLAAATVSTELFLYSFSVEQLQEVSLTDITDFSFWLRSRVAFSQTFIKKLYWIQLPSSHRTTCCSCWSIRVVNELYSQRRLVFKATMCNFKPRSTVSKMKLVMNATLHKTGFRAAVENPTVD